MTYSELKLRIAPWLALALGLSWGTIVLIRRGLAVTWDDIRAPFNVILAGVVLFVGMRFLSLRIESQIRNSIRDQDDHRSD